MKKIVVFGGSGGLGQMLKEQTDINDKNEYIFLSSKDINITNIDEIKDFFKNRPYNIEQIINLSGINIDSTLSKLNTEVIDKMINVNIKGTLSLVSESINYFKNNEIEGNIVLMSSILSTNPVFGTGLYSACKSFIDNIVKTCSIENSKYNIRCNSIQLGYFDGGMTYTIGEEMLETLRQTIPLKRYGNGEELYKSIKFLQENKYITGQSIRISGGL